MSHLDADNTDRDYWFREAESAHNEWLDMVEHDAEKEYQMGDVDRNTLEEFVGKLKIKN